MICIGPRHNNRQDYIVLNAVENYGTIWEKNTEGELFYIADSFSDYIMSILRGHIKRSQYNYIEPRWTNNIGHQLMTNIRFKISDISLDNY